MSGNQSLSRLFQLLSQQTKEAPDRTLPRSAREGRGRGLAAAIAEEHSSDELDDVPSLGHPSLGASLDIPQLELTHPIPFSKLVPSASCSSDSTTSLTISAVNLRKLCRSTTEPNQVECLLLPERFTIKGGRDHKHTGHTYFVNNSDKILLHLKRWHPRIANELQDCEKNARIESRIQELVRDYESEKKKTLSHSRPTTIDNWALSHRQEAIRASQALMILANGQSFRSLESIWWPEMFASAGLDRQVGLNRKDFKSRYFPHIFTVIQRKISSLLNGNSNPSITADCWTDRKMRSYMAITLHWINKDRFLMEHALLDLYPLEERHTSEYLCRSIETAINSVVSDQVTIQCAVGDGAQNSAGSLRDYVGYENFFWCFAHRINLVVRHSIDSIGYKLEEVRELIRGIRMSTILRSKLREKSNLEIILDCPTRWSSTYEMLKRLDDILLPLRQLINDDSDFVQLVIPHWLTSNFLSTLSAILKPFAEISTLSQSDSYPTLFAIPLWIRYLKAELQHVQQTLTIQTVHKTLADRLLSNLEHYFYTSENNVFRSDSLPMKALYLSCQITFLQPEDLKAIRNHLIPEFRSLKLHQSLEPLRNIIDDAFLDKVLEALQNSLPVSYPISITVSDPLTVINCDSPFDWWREIGSKSFPFIIDLARVFLSIPATSAPSESVFSRAGIDDRSNRSRLGAETLRSSLIVVRNAHLFDPSTLLSEVVAETVRSTLSRKRTSRSESSSSSSLPHSSSSLPALDDAEPGFDDIFDP